MSETTTTTGWHRHEKTGTIHQAAACFLDDAHPVIWLDPADPTVRETIARALIAHLDGPCADPRCHMLGRRNVGPLSEHLAEEIAAALASATEEAER